MARLNLDEIYTLDDRGTDIRALDSGGAVVNVMHRLFEAVGDGVADDSAALTAALAAGNEVIVPPNAVLLVSDVEVGSGKRISGGGTIKKASTAEQALHITGDGVKIEGLTFAGQSTSGQPNADIKLGEGAANVIISDNIFDSPTYSAISAAEDSGVGGIPYTTHVSGVLITGNIFKGGYARPMHLHSVDNLTISNNIIRDCNFDAIRLRENDGYTIITGNQFIDIGDPSWPDDQTRDAVDSFWGGQYLLITNNIIRRASYQGLDIKLWESTGTYGSTRVIIQGNQIFDCRYSGINVQGSEALGGGADKHTWMLNISDNIVEGCNRDNEDASGGAANAAINLKELVKYVKVHGNIVVGNFGQGIRVGKAPSTLSRSIIVTNNIACNNGASNSTSLDAGIYINQADGLVLTGNIAEDDADLPNPNSQQCGIYITGASSTRKMIVEGNIVRNNIANQLYCDPTNARVDALFSFRSNLQEGTAAYPRNWMANRRLLFGSATPAALEGTFQRGDRIEGISPTVGGAERRICTADGNPGTWVLSGIVGGVQAAAQADSTATDVAGIVSDFNALLAKLRTANLLDT